MSANISPTAYMPPNATYFDQGTHPYEGDYPESLEDLGKMVCNFRPGRRLCQDHDDPQHHP